MVGWTLEMQKLGLQILLEKVKHLVWKMQNVTEIMRSYTSVTLENGSWRFWSVRISLIEFFPLELQTGLEDNQN